MLSVNLLSDMKVFVFLGFGFCERKFFQPEALTHEFPCPTH